MQLSFFIKGQNCPNTRQPSHYVLRIDLKKGENRVYIFPSHLFQRSLVDGFELSMCQDAMVSPLYFEWLPNFSSHFLEFKL